MDAETKSGWNAVLGRASHDGFHPLDKRAVYEFVVAAWRNGEVKTLSTDDLGADLRRHGAQEEWISWVISMVEDGPELLDLARAPGAS